MKTVLIFAGTTEGRELVECFDRSGIPCHVCVATAYGSQVLKASPNIVIHQGRLEENDMRELYRQIGCQIVVDATHPYAEVVTSLIQKSIAHTDITYLRLTRSEGNKAAIEKVRWYDTVKQCAEALSQTQGRILLTTGSKHLAEFTAQEELKTRIVARVIPDIESLTLCHEAGLEGNQIIAIQGPFSKEMNQAMLKAYKIEHLVTKDSGATGGVNEKIEAANSLGVEVHMLKRPERRAGARKEAGLSLAETLCYLEQALETTMNRGTLEVFLVGIGPGSREVMTKEALEAMDSADVVFGAKRMLAALENQAKKYPYYLPEDVIPQLTKLAEERVTDTKAVILFSGDTGFYSGCRKLYEALLEHIDWKIRILPGISSIAMLCARIGIDWQDGRLLSFHGAKQEDWMPKLLASVKYNQKTFFITSGVEDIQLLGKLLEGKEGLQLYLGYQLSYPEEEVLSISPRECCRIRKEGLYTGVILSENIEPKLLVPVLEDTDFIRHTVPMTKEEIRKLSICQMKLQEKDIVYDIGCGTGSVAVQIGMLSEGVRVFAVECNPAAVELTKQNIRKAGLLNVSVIEAMAPEGLEALPPANVAFIGGSKGRLLEILEVLYRKNASMRIVITAVSLETLWEIKHILDTWKLRNVSLQQIAVNPVKQLGEYHMLQANNPVVICSFTFVPESREE